MSEDKGVIPWIFIAPGLARVFSRLPPSGFGESKMDLRELTIDMYSDAGSDRLVDAGPGVIFILMKGVDVSSSFTAVFFGEYEAGVFWVLGFGAKGTFVSVDDAPGVGIGACFA